MGQIEHIRSAYFRQRKSIRKITREFHHSRKTVRKAIYGGGGIPRYKRKKVHRCPVLNTVKPIIDGWLEEDTRRPRKQRHTARRIYQRLVQEQGFEGSESRSDPLNSRHLFRATFRRPSRHLVSVPGRAQGN